MSNPFQRPSETPAPRSGGPQTPEGKAVSSRNALKHGLTARAVVIFGEDADEYESFRSGFISRLAPADQLEEFLVDRVAACAWRLRRVVRVESEIFEDYESIMNRRHVMVAKSAAHAVMVDAGGVGAFAQLARHEAAIERSMLRALHELQRLQATRAGEQVPVPVAIDVTVSAND